jgi:hypothetical protein
MPSHRGAALGVAGERGQEGGEVTQPRQGVAQAEQLELDRRFKLESRRHLE